MPSVACCAFPEFIDRPLILISAFCLLLAPHSIIPQNARQSVAQPALGGTESLREGPWPACVELQFDHCRRYIETYAEDVRGHIYKVEPEMMVTMDFRTDRVWVHVDEDGYVNQIPKRG